MLRVPNSAGDKDSMSKDEPEDSKALALMKQKLILTNKGLVEGQSSKAWSELVTSSFRHSGWEERQPGRPGFNKHAQQMMEKHNVPDSQLVSVPVSKACVQPYQQVVSYLAHPEVLLIEPDYDSFFSQ